MAISVTDEAEVDICMAAPIRPESIPVGKGPAKAVAGVSVVADVLALEDEVVVAVVALVADVAEDDEASAEASGGGPGGAGDRDRGEGG